jgi:small-conductance mechanosensitive channel
MLETFLDYLKTPLVVLGNTPVTTLTLLAAVAIVVGARIIAAIVGRSLERIFASRGLETGLRFAINKMVRYTITLVGVVAAVGTLGVDTSAVMAGGAVLLVGIGFGLQKLRRTSSAGCCSDRAPVRKGDFIDVAARSAPSRTSACARHTSCPATDSP